MRRYVWLRFIDAIYFLAMTKLDALIESLCGRMPILESAIIIQNRTDEQIERMMKRKGIYCYSDAMTLVSLLDSNVLRLKTYIRPCEWLE